MQRNYLAMIGRILSTLAFLLFSLLATAQPDPVQWSFSLDTARDGSLLVNANADIDDGWKLYGHNIDEGGPIRTDLVIEERDGLTAEAQINETGNLHGPETDEIFEVTVSYFTGTATFTRAFKTENATAVNGYVEFMVCDDQRCLPPKEVTFDLKL